MVVPAPHNSICPTCQKVVNTGSTDIVRYNGKIFHHSQGCFDAYKPRAVRGHALMLGKGVQLERKPTVHQVILQAQEILNERHELTLDDLYILDRSTNVVRPLISIVKAEHLAGV